MYDQIGFYCILNLCILNFIHLTKIIIWLLYNLMVKKVLLFLLFKSSWYDFSIEISLFLITVDRWKRFNFCVSKLKEKNVKNIIFWSFTLELKKNKCVYYMISKMKRITLYMVLDLSQKKSKKSSMPIEINK